MRASEVEASSLSDITQLAANPPKYPRNPTEPQRSSLTLYIARVPGSRDVILTTLKPLLKNVTVEDVAASLYYLHLNTEEDARLLESDVKEIPSDTGAASQKPLPRKPLPESAKSSLDLSRKMNPELMPSAGQPKRKPVARSPIDILQARNQFDLPEVRPLGPRPLLSESTLSNKTLPPVENGAFDGTSWTWNPSQTIKASSESNRCINSRSFLGTDSTPGRDCFDPFSITLIRRDPSSGAQWNIGTITASPDDEASGRPKATRRGKKPYFAMSIHLSTPGYNQFRVAQPTTHTRDDITTSHRSVNDDHRANANIATTEWGFDRRIRIERRGRPNIKHKRATSNNSAKLNTTRGFNDMITVESDEMPNLSDTSGLTDSHAKGYTFTSPWGGHCQFSTGLNGRSLKCKHTLPAPISAGGTATSSSAVIISELRFNLPSSGVFKSSSASDTKDKNGTHSRRFSIPKLGNIRDKLSHKVHSPLPLRPDPTSYAAMYPSDDEYAPSFPPRSDQSSEARGNDLTHPHQIHPSYRGSSPSGEDDDRDRLDLSIGKEKAGGGNRGKRAKLGKLIIMDEGFKMLDLVVAANMSIWWSAWESDNQ